MSNNAELAITTNQLLPVDEEESAIPLSPASVRSYQKNKAQKSKKQPSKDQPFSEESDSDSDDESDKKSDEDEDEDAFDATHLHPRFEALDGTTKLKSATEKDQEEEEEDESSNDEDDSTEAQSLRDGVADLSLAGASSGAVGTKTALEPSTPIAPDVVVNDTVGTAASPSPSASSSTVALSQGQEERLQEPVKPHIALPCLVETARNPARTRITLKYSGNEHTTTTKATEVEQEQKTATRGRKNYMVATDLSGESWHATEWAITTILRSGDELNVVTIVEDDKGENAKGIKKGVQAEMREDAEKLTKNIHEQLEHTNLKDITVIIHIIAATRSMGAKELLIEMIDDLDDLSTVIVGSRGRGAIKGLLLGSISNFLVQNSSVPVMVVRSPKKSKGKKKLRNGRLLEHTRSVKEANQKYRKAFGDDDDF